MFNYIFNLMPDDVRRFIRSIRTKWLLARQEPSSRNYGYDRGKPIGRYYTDLFIARYKGEIRGNVLEIGVPIYSKKYSENVSHYDVLDVVPDNPKANLVGDLNTGRGVPKETYDCVVITSVYPYTFDVQSAVRNSYLALRSGGTLLATMPGIAQVFLSKTKSHGDFWRFTDASVLRLFSDAFGAANIDVQTYGNVLSASAYLHGLSADELTRAELDFQDTDYQVCIGVRAVKTR